MARVRLNETKDLPEEHRQLFERIEEQGLILNIYRALSHSPVALRNFMRLGRYLLTQGKLDPKFRELAILRAGYLCRSPYEFSQHISFGRRVGLSDSQIRAIAKPDVGPFDASEMAVVNFASELTAGARVSDSAFAAVRAFLDEEQIVELTLVTGFYNMVSRALNALEVDIDEPAQKDLDQIGVAL